MNRKSLIMARGQSTLLVLALMFPPVSLSQTDEEPELARNAVYLELFGQGGLYSINYEYRFLKNFSARAGFSIWSFPFLVADIDFIGAPLMVNCLIGGRYANLELGAGVIVLSASATDFFVERTGSTGLLAIPTGTIGYRHQAVDGGFIFRVGLAPVYYDNRVYPGYGLSFGHAF